MSGVVPSHEIGAGSVTMDDMRRIVSGNRQAPILIWGM